jgi:hypothetical protein
MTTTDRKLASASLNEPEIQMSSDIRESIIHLGVRLDYWSRPIDLKVPDGVGSLVDGCGPAERQVLAAGNQK